MSVASILLVSLSPHAFAPAPAPLLWGAPPPALRPARADGAAMVLAPSTRGLGDWNPFAPRAERIREGGCEVDFRMEIVHLTKRRVSGGVAIAAPAADVWRAVTSYERFPDFIPSIISHDVRRGEAGRAVIDQVSQLSRRLNMRSQMTLEAVESPDARSVTLRRVSGHGFLEFEGQYSLSPRPDGSTYLGYSVELVPCPIFPLPLVEQKIRKEVPKMLAAMSRYARRL